MDTQRINRRDDCIAALFCLICAAALLMVCSMNSWLYPVNPWVDVNIIATVGRGMFDGLVPYRDLVEQKGPLLFLIFGAGMKLTPGTYHGLYLLETLFMAAAMFFGWKTVRLYVPRLHVVWMAPLYAVLMGSAIFCSGGSAEEFVLPLFGWSIYDLLRCWKKGVGLKTSALVRNGFLAGCVLWIKFNLLGVHFVWMAAIALDALVCNKRIMPSVRMCIAFLSGMALASLPWLIYFGANGALGDLTQSYFYDNIFRYGQGSNWILNVAHGLLEIARQAPVYFVLLALEGAVLLFTPRARMSVREKVTLIMMQALLLLLMYSKSSSNIYYGILWMAFIPFAMLPLGIVPVRAKKGTGRLIMATVMSSVIAVSVLFAYVQYSGTRNIGVPYENTPQARLAKEIQNGGIEKPTLIQYRSMDMGVYFASGARPAHRWFTFLNVRQQECVDTVQALVDAGVPDYVVTGTWTGESIRDLDRYEKVLEFGSNYGMREDERMIYCLYRRTEED